MSALLKIKHLLFIILLAGASGGLCLRYADRMVDAIYISSDDVKLTLRGEIPAQTALQITAEYGSASCSGEELLREAGPDNDYRSTSTLSRTFRVEETAHPYQVDLPLDDFGKCAWHLQSIRAQFSWQFAPPRMMLVNAQFDIERCTNDSQINLPSCRPNDPFSPVIYTLRHESDDGSWDELITIDPLALKPAETARWLPAQPRTLFVDVDQKTAVSLTLALKPEYVVRLIEDAHGNENTVIYPDGTTWFYTTSLNASPPAGAQTGEQMTLYSPYRNEACLNTLQQPAKGVQKGPLRENDYCR